jgi:hypothetical protein
MHLDTVLLSIYGKGFYRRPNFPHFSHKLTCPFRLREGIFRKLSITCSPRATLFTDLIGPPC